MLFARSYLKKRNLLLEAAFGIVVLQSPLSSLEPLGKIERSTDSSKESLGEPTFLQDAKGKDSYTINFSNVSIVEYIRFVSRITGLNFIFNEEELQFTVTVVSEDPVSSENVLSTLIQVLRVHNLSILEQEGNILITSSKEVSQAATVVSEETTHRDIHPTPPIVTRVFQVKNGNIATIATVVKPLLSSTALLEISPETKQLIITDITTNVDKISSLLLSIDTPHSFLEVDTYNAEHTDPQELIALATQILTPLSGGNPLIFVPQPGTKSIFIVSTPHLIDKALAVFEDLDQSVLTEPSALPNANSVFLYKIRYQPSATVLESLEKIGTDLEPTTSTASFLSTLKKAQFIQASNSILFSGDSRSLEKVKELMPMIDTPIDENSVLLYQVKSIPADQLLSSLKTIATNLKNARHPDEELIFALQSASLVEGTTTVIFSGSPKTLQQLSEIVGTIDKPSFSSFEQVFLYKPKFVSKDQLQSALAELAANLPESPHDIPLKRALSSVKWVDDSQAFLFKIEGDSVEPLKLLLQDIDSPEVVTGGNTFFLYKLKNAPCSTVTANLERVADNLKKSGIPNESLLEVIQNAKCLEDSNALILTGSVSGVNEAKRLIDEFDVATSTIPGKSSFFIYKPKYQSAETIQKDLSLLAEDLESSGLVDSQLLDSIRSMRYADSNDSLVFTGAEPTLDKIRQLVTGIDTLSPEEAQVQKLGETSFIIYKIQFVPAAQLVSSLRSLSVDLQQTGAIDPQVVSAINGMKWIKETNSLLFVGSPKTLDKVELMLKKFDIPALAIKAEGTSDLLPGTFVVYNPKFVPGDELILILNEFEQNLLSSGVLDKNLQNTIAHLKWIPKTSSLLISGDPESIKKVEDLLTKFDVPSKKESDDASTIGAIDDTSFLIYKLQYHQGNEIATALKQITAEVTKTPSPTNQSLINAINSLQWIRITNSLLASGDPTTLGKLKTLVQNLDVPLRQIFIEVLVIETSVNNTQNFGLQWGGRMQYLNRFGAATGNFPVPNANSSQGGSSFNSLPSNPGIGSGIVGSSNGNGGSTSSASTTNIPFLSGFDLGVIGDIIMHKGQSFISLGSLVNALQLDTDSTVVMNPKIITQDNRNSTIFVGNNIPFIGSFVVSQQNFVSQSQNIEYRDIGFNLSITPTIGSNDIVTMDISNDISAVISTPTIGSTGNNSSNQTITGIQTSHTSMTTRVHVPNQHFVVLSGMLQDSKARYKSQIPCLGGLPIIGAAFSETDRANSKQNVIIFVRPHIINTTEEFKIITDNQESLYKEQAGLPSLQEEFDAGIDLVKAPENE